MSHSKSEVVRSFIIAGVGCLLCAAVAFSLTLTASTIAINILSLAVATIALCMSGWFLIAAGDLSTY